MYHVGGGGKGVQLTEKPNWTANIGEPVVEPKGRFVYFVSSGAFDYNKNVYDNIYWIDRYDMQKGRRSTFVRGAGGSIRPQVSPDGKYLSFIRRVGIKTALFVREIETGREWPLFDGLTRDQQETWALYGTYPGYSWTPDGKSIVITALGKFVRVNVGENRSRPFLSARTSRRRSARPCASGRRSRPSETARACSVGPSATANASSTALWENSTSRMATPRRAACSTRTTWNTRRAFAPTESSSPS